ncbi:hypothetical protein ACHAXS_003774 [Conticribra weissflogii]
MTPKKHKKLRYKMFRGEDDDEAADGADDRRRQPMHPSNSTEQEPRREESTPAVRENANANANANAATGPPSNEPGIPLQPDLDLDVDQEGDLRALAPIPLTYSRSSPLRQHRLYHRAWVQPPADDGDAMNASDSTSSSDPLFPSFSDFQPNHLTRANSTPLPLRSGRGSAFSLPEKLTGSDPGISGLSAFSPVWSARSRSCASAADGSEGGASCWSAGAGDAESGQTFDDGAASQGRERGTRRVKKNFFKLFGRRRIVRSGRENPAGPALSEDEREEGKEDFHGDDGGGLERGSGGPPFLDVGDIVEVGDGPTEGNATRDCGRRRNVASARTDAVTAGNASTLSDLFSNNDGAETYDDPGVELACSSSSDEDEGDHDDNEGDTIAKSHYHLIEGDNESPRPPSIEPGIEVTTEMISTPATLEASPIAEASPISAAESSPAYHPLADEVDQDDGGNYQRGTVQVQLKYKLPKQVISPAPLAARPTTLTNDHHHSTNTRNSLDRPSDEGSPSSNSTITPTRQAPIQHDSPSHSQDSRLSSSTSRTARQSSTPNTAHTDSSLDYEVRDANRPALHSSSSYRNREEVEVEHDGNATVFSSSTTSSHMYSYINSPRPLREGATIQSDRYFAGGNVVLSPTKKDGTHSPHTVSSASVSNTSSSGSDSHTPLKFVAYANARQNGHPVEERDTPASIIQPRIQNPLPPRSSHTHASYFSSKPPRSPDRLETVINNNPNSTPIRCRTPPTRNQEVYGNNSGANTPCSPPVIVDQDTVIRRNLENPGTVRPNVVRGHSRVRGKSSSLILIPPSGSPSNPVRTPISQPMESPIVNNLTVVVGESANDGAQEVFTASVDTTYPIPTVSPDGGVNRNNDSGNHHRQMQLSPRKLIPRGQHRRVMDGGGSLGEGDAPFNERDTAQFLTTSHGMPLRLEASQPSVIDGGALVSPEK